MIRHYITVMVSFVLLLLLMTPTNALYEQTFSLESGAITTDSIDMTPPETEFDSVTQVKNNLYVSSGTITTDMYVTNGPITVSSGTITGAIMTNHGVSISGASAIQGPIHRQEVSFHPKQFDYSMVPTNLPVLGEFSTSNNTVIDSNGQYYNMNIGAPLTIDTTKEDVIIITNYLNISAEIRVVGNHRATLIVKHGMNVNHNAINSTTKHGNFNLVVQGWSLSLQNDINFYGNLYFEGNSLYLRNRIQIHGAIYAPYASVELDASTLSGAINCDNLTLYQNSKVLEKKG